MAGLFKRFDVDEDFGGHRVVKTDVFDPAEVAILHIVYRVVRRCFIFVDDPISGKNFDHRKVWIERQLERLSSSFGIDLLCFAILSTSFHLILRSRPNVMATWDDSEVARSWLMICPIRKKNDQSPDCTYPRTIESRRCLLEVVRQDFGRFRIS